MITLRDVAAEVGVSASTVSLVLNDQDRGRVRPDLADQVRAAAERLGYEPNLLAKSLQSRKTHTIGVISESVASSQFSSEMLAGAQDAARAAGYMLVLVDIGADGPEKADEVIRMLVRRDVEGIIIATDFHRTRAIPTVAKRLPVVFLDCVPEAPDAEVFATVVPDERAGARHAVERLVELGHRRVAHIGVSDRDYLASGLRLKGFTDALDAAGIPISPWLRVVAANPSTAAGRVAAEQLLDLPLDERPTAIFCFSDQIAWGVLQVARSKGVRIPDELAVVGFDNHRFIAEATLPALTTVELPHRHMGELAVEACLRALTRPRSGRQHITVECPLIIRDSDLHPMSKPNAEGVQP